jgi:hypothetical protein
MFEQCLNIGSTLELIRQSSIQNMNIRCKWDTAFRILAWRQLAANIPSPITHSKLKDMRVGGDSLHLFCPRFHSSHLIQANACKRHAAPPCYMYKIYALQNHPNRSQTPSPQTLNVRQNGKNSHPTHNLIYFPLFSNT